MGNGHPLFVVGEACLNATGIQVEVLGVHWWSEGRDSLAWCSPKSRHHINGEGQRNESSHDAYNGHRLVEVATYFILLELQPATEVGTQHTKNDNPQREEYFAVEQMPAVGKVGYGEKLKCKGQFYEA